MPTNQVIIQENNKDVKRVNNVTTHFFSSEPLNAYVIREIKEKG
jgi:hypothetical protein